MSFTNEEFFKLKADMESIIPLFEKVLRQNKEILAMNEALTERMSINKVIDSKEFAFIEEMKFARVINKSLMYAIITDVAMADDIINAAKLANDKDVVDFWTSKIENKPF